MLQNPHSHQFFAIVSAVHHQWVGDALNNGALGLTETLGGVATSTVWQVNGIFLLDWKIILQNGKMWKVKLHGWHTVAVLFDLFFYTLSKVWLRAKWKSWSYVAEILPKRRRQPWVGNNYLQCSFLRSIFEFLTVKLMSEIWTSSQDQRPKSLISGSSAGGGGWATATAVSSCPSSAMIKPFC